MMKKILFAAALAMMSAFAQSAATESQAITDLIAATFNLNNTRLVETGKFLLSERTSGIDSQAHLKASLSRTPFGTENGRTVAFKDATSLSYVVNQGALNELIQNGDISKLNDGSLLMTSDAKSRLLSSAVNMGGFVEAKRIVIKGGVVILSGQ
jgi:hypothetical protein